jgi:hypothetical protein
MQAMADPLTLSQAVLLPQRFVAEKRFPPMPNPPETPHSRAVYGLLYSVLEYTQMKFAEQATSGDTPKAPALSGVAADSVVADSGGPSAPAIEAPASALAASARQIAPILICLIVLSHLRLRRRQRQICKGRRAFALVLLCTRLF